LSSNSRPAFDIDSGSAKICFMAKAELKTRPNDGDVEAFLNEVEDERQRSESFELLKIFTQITGERPIMWGSAIVGFGSVKLKYASGRELDWPIAAFSPRNGNFSLYLEGYHRQKDLMARLGKYKLGKSCLYIKRLGDVDREVLEKVIRNSVEHMQNGGQPEYS
jgi:hypothetical protein